jgi:hypothetical protein
MECGIAKAENCTSATMVITLSKIHVSDKVNHNEASDSYEHDGCNKVTNEASNSQKMNEDTIPRHVVSNHEREVYVSIHLGNP